MTDLLPCPFCGGEATMQDDAPDSEFGCHHPVWFVFCQGCGISTDTSVDSENCVKDWNTRHTPTVDAALVDRVAKVIDEAEYAAYNEMNRRVETGQNGGGLLKSEMRKWQAKAVLATINFPAIRAQARKEALEEGFRAGEKSMKEKAAKEADLMADTFPKGDGLTASCDILRRIKCIPTGSIEEIRKLIEKEG